MVVTAGANMGFLNAMMAVADPGDEVILPLPYYFNQEMAIRMVTAVPVPVPTDAHYRLRLDLIDAAITPRTRAIVTVSPNNPTGVIYPRASLTALGEMLERKERELQRQIYVISDEPYARLAYDGAEVPGIFGCVRNSVIVTSHSKDLALPGERIGYLAANPAMHEVGRFIEGAVFCNRVLGFVNAPALMQRLVAKLQRESVDIEEYRVKRDRLYDHLTGLGFRMVRPGGGFYLFPRSPLPDDVAFVRLAQKHNILLVPGTGFGAPGHFRIAYCVESAVIERSLPAWERVAKEAGL